MPLLSLALVSLAVGWPTTCASTEEWRATDWTLGQADAITLIEERRVVLAPFTCKNLRSRNIYKLGVALHALAHERQHVIGITDEDVADCQGLRTMIGVGIAAGYSPMRTWRAAVALVSDDGAADWMTPCYPF